MIKKRSLFYLLLGLITFTFTVAAQGEKNVDIETKELIGIVGYKDSRYIAIVYEKKREVGKEYEISFEIPKNIKVSRKKSLDDIYRGDTVKAIYGQKFREVEVEKGNGRKEKVKKIIGRNLKEIVFIKPAATGLRSGSEGGKRYKNVSEHQHGLTIEGSAMDVLGEEEQNE